MSVKALKDRVEGLQADAQRLARQLSGEVGGGSYDWGIDDPISPTVSAVGPSFPREEFDQAYQKALEGSAEEQMVGRAMVAKLRSDLMASMQQSYLLRRRGRIRAFSLAASRLVGHADHILPNGWLRPIGQIEEALEQR